MVMKEVLQAERAPAAKACYVCFFVVYLFLFLHVMFLGDQELFTVSGTKGVKGIEARKGLLFRQKSLTL